LERKHGGSRVDDISRARKGRSTIKGGGENHVIAIGPHRIQSAVWRDSSGKPFDGPVIIARESANIVNLHGLGPRLAVIRGANEQNLRIG
jgi:hypothetical protein